MSGINYNNGVIITFETNDYSCITMLFQLIRCDIIWEVLIIDWQNYRSYVYEKLNTEDRNMNFVEVNFDKYASRVLENLGKEKISIQLQMLQISERNIKEILHSFSLYDLLERVVRLPIESQIEYETQSPHEYENEIRENMETNDNYQKENELDLLF
ncbi:hypothetical protein [Piscibacillus salipiscarius]|uniref:hypothetical protein n=1 Tax=Piscibacillus salipiscarius TaxID=299480 RepID=UPI0006D19E47|nr:hypothetical protein [Piscibacillus salipiscarius]